MVEVRWKLRAGALIKYVNLIKLVFITLDGNLRYCVYSFKNCALRGGYISTLQFIHIYG